MQEGDIIPSSVAQWDCTKNNNNTLLLPAKAGYCFSSDSKRKTLDYSLVFWGFSVYLKCCGGARDWMGRGKVSQHVEVLIRWSGAQQITDLKDESENVQTHSWYLVKGKL